MSCKDCEKKAANRKIKKPKGKEKKENESNTKKME
jgi:hypothetical protein